MLLTRTPLPPPPFVHSGHALRPQLRALLTQALQQTLLCLDHLLRRDALGVLQKGFRRSVQNTDLWPVGLLRWPTCPQHPAQEGTA